MDRERGRRYALAMGLTLEQRELLDRVLAVMLPHDDDRLTQWRLSELDAEPSKLVNGQPAVDDLSMDPDLRRRMARMYKRGAISGAILLAIGLGLILGGNHEPAVIGFAICMALATAGQLWAGRRNG